MAAAPFRCLLGTAGARRRSALLLALLALLLPAPASARCTDRPAAQVDWSGCKKNHLSLTAMGLEGAIMVKTQLSGTDFSEAKLKGADLSKSEISNAWFVKADLSKATFTGAFGTRTRFTNANLAGADLSKSEFFRTDMNGANLEGADLRGAQLVRATFDGARLAGSQLAASNLSRAVLSGANLADTDLTGAYLLSDALRKHRPVARQGADRGADQDRMRRCDDEAAAGCRRAIHLALRRALRWRCGGPALFDIIRLIADRCRGGLRRPSRSRRHVRKNGVTTGFSARRTHARCGVARCSCRAWHAVPAQPLLNLRTTTVEA